MARHHLAELKDSGTADVLGSAGGSSLAESAGTGLRPWGSERSVCGGGRSCGQPYGQVRRLWGEWHLAVVSQAEHDRTNSSTMSVQPNGQTTPGGQATPAESHPGTLPGWRKDSGGAKLTFTNQTDVADREREEFEQSLLQEHSRRISLDRSPIRNTQEEESNVERPLSDRNPNGTQKFQVPDEEKPHHISPRKERSQSLDSIRVDGAGSKKRKAVGSPQLEDMRMEKQKLWARMTEKMSELWAMIQETPKTKRDIKKAGEDLQSLMTVLSQIDREVEGSFSAHQRVDKVKDHTPVSYCSVATQTEEYTDTLEARPFNGQSELTVEEIRSKIFEGMDTSQIQQITAIDWPERAYARTTLCKSSILGVEADDMRVVFVNEDKFSKSQLERNLCSQVPGLKGKKVSSENFLMVESTDSVKLEGEEIVEKSRLLVVVGLKPAQDNKPFDETDILNKLRRIRQMAEKRSETSLSLAVPEESDFIKIRKIVECCLAGSEVSVNIRLGKRMLRGNKDPDRVNKRSLTNNTHSHQECVNEDDRNWNEVKRRKKKIHTQDSVIVVSKEGKTYSEILKAVKEGVNPVQLPTATTVTAIQRTGKEGLLIRVKGPSKTAESLCKAVAEKVPEFSTRLRAQKKAVIHISDLDEETSKEDIEQGVRSELGLVDLQDVEVTSIRPAFAQTQKATLKLPHSAADRLVRKGRIRIGWVSCRVRLREDQQRCFRCWETGHIASACRGPDNRQ
jgi:CTP-dependent riboflavin kinase